MNLQKLFEKQKVLMERIEKEHPVEPNEDRFSKRILALLVELGECANEQRTWKYWSTKRDPRTKVIVKEPQGQCADIIKYPLLEEYVDGLHFVLEHGIEIEVDPMIQFKLDVKINVVSQYLYLFDVISFYRNFRSIKNYKKILDAYMGLGYMLGFDLEQIEQAYDEKNAVNHARQDGGY